MKTVKVTYTIHKDFVPENLQNIRTFMTDFRRMQNDDFRYAVFQSEDGQTFLHLSMYANDEIQKQVLAIDSFKTFQQRRDASGLDGSHRIEMLTHVASSHEALP
jgi:hypothetical protein